MGKDAAEEDDGVCGGSDSWLMVTAVKFEDTKEEQVWQEEVSTVSSATF